MLRIVAEPEAIALFHASIKKSPTGEIRVPVRVANPVDQSRFWESDFLIDTAPTISIVPADVLDAIGVDAREIVRVYMADGSSALRRVGLLRYTVVGISRTAEVVYGPEGVEPLLGGLQLGSMGLLVDQAGERLLPRSAISPTFD